MKTSHMHSDETAVHVGNESVRDLMDRQAREYPDHVYLIAPDSGRQLTYQNVQQHAQAIASHIARCGVEPGASVAYAMHNSLCCALSVLGIMYGGYRAVAINLVAGRDVIAYVLAHSQTALVVTQTEHTALISEALSSDAFTNDHSQAATPKTIADSGESLDVQRSKSERSDENISNTASQRSSLALPVQVLDESLIQSWIPKIDSVGLSPLRAGNDALLMYTSGTTGRPKGVTLSHDNVQAGGRNVVAGHQLSSNDRALCVLPLYHINGLCVTLFGPLVSAGSLVLPQRFSTSVFWQQIEEFACTWFSVVPTQIAYLLRDADTGGIGRTLRPGLRFGRSASAPLSPDVHGTFEKQFGIPLIETMGLTETAAQILTNPMPPLQRKLGSPGLPVGNEIIIVDKQLNRVDNGVEGEILVRGPNVMQRYFRNDEATTEAIVKGGWLRTGDLGRKDEDGYVFVTGRLKELIIKGGENIAPREIDDALYQHGDVVEAAAFACPCDDFGQRVEAAVVLKASSCLDESELIETCKQRVGSFKCPDKIHFLSELPKGPSGKIQRAKIRDFILSQR